MHRLSKHALATFGLAVSCVAAAIQIDNVVVNGPGTVREPATMLLFGIGLAVIGGALRRRRKAQV